MSIYGFLKGTGPSGYGYDSTTDAVTEGVDLSSKRYLLTGCNSGLGLETLRTLTARGATVIAAARTQEKAEQAIEEAGVKGGPGDATPVACELAEPASIEKTIDVVKESGHELSGIIANAGIMALPERELVHGVEKQLFTNHFGHFLLITPLLDRLEADARVVVLSSSAHNMTYKEGIRFDDLDASKQYKPWAAYGQSKLANLLFVRLLAERLPQPGQRANAVHPGMIATNLQRHMGDVTSKLLKTVGGVVMLKTIPQGAATQVYVATHPGARHINGQYWADCNVAKSSAHGRDMDLAKKLWDRTSELIEKL